jgi:hypothetical protein
MVAAYNLAREGRSVIVREKEPGFGGSSAFNPSTHTTPLDLAATSEYIGIDISPAFKPVNSLSLYIHDFRIDAPVVSSYHVERSSRPESLDALLYAKCREAGVAFEFDRSLRKEEISRLPHRTIIACGLNPEAYDYLEIPYDDWYAWTARGEADRPNDAWIWLDECINEYGYVSFCNGIYFNLLFSNGQEVEKAGLERYRDFMRRVEGMEEEDWEYIRGATPVATPDNPRLIRKGLIMAGTISGCIDPFMGFGISGALVSGKVAALAVTDREKAEAEFSRFTRNFAKVFNFKRDFWRRLRGRVDLLEEIARILGPERCVGLLVDGIRHGRKNSAIPGFSPVSCS